MNKALSAVTLLTFSIASYGQNSRSLDKRVSSLIEKMTRSSTEQQSFADLDALGCPAVPAIIRQMDDQRDLPDPNISLKNKSPDAFENRRFYGPKKVVDALAAILNQITWQDFGFIYNGATDKERSETVRKWRDFLHKTPTLNLCKQNTSSKNMHSHPKELE